MADASRNFTESHYPNFYHVMDTLKAEMDARNEMKEVSIILNKVSPTKG